MSDSVDSASVVEPASGTGVASNAGPEVGARVRRAREQRGIGLRELARRINVSPSLISQIERGKAMPSVATLYAMVSELDVSLDSLFADVGEAENQVSRGRGDSTPTPHSTSTGDGNPNRPVRSDSREAIKLASGVTWERLTSGEDPVADFLHVIYEPGGASSEQGLVRHAGREYGYVLSGRLGVAVGFERFELGPHDSIAFDSAHPHRLWTIGAEPVHAVWCVVGRASQFNLGDRDAPADGTSARET
jgi:transcriptional regulator with XRE-family HTH domain